MINLRKCKHVFVVLCEDILYLFLILYNAVRSLFIVFNISGYSKAYSTWMTVLLTCNSK